MSGYALGSFHLQRCFFFTRKAELNESTVHAPWTSLLADEKSIERV